MPPLRAAFFVTLASLRGYAAHQRHTPPSCYFADTPPCHAPPFFQPSLFHDYATFAMPFFSLPLPARYADCRRIAARQPRRHFLIRFAFSMLMLATPPF